MLHCVSCQSYHIVHGFPSPSLGKGCVFSGGDPRHNHWWIVVKLQISSARQRCASSEVDNCRNAILDQPVSDSRPCHLRSSDSLTCVVRRAHNTYGNRCFDTARARVLNFLPAELQSCDSLRQFKRCLKTFLFGSWDYGALWRSIK